MWFNLSSGITRSVKKIFLASYLLSDFPGINSFFNAAVLFLDAEVLLTALDKF